MEKQQSNPQHQRRESTPCEAQSDHSEDRVDLTLIRWMLSLTPTERLEVLQSAAPSLARLKNGTIRT